MTMIFFSSACTGEGRRTTVGEIGEEEEEEEGRSRMMVGGCRKRRSATLVCQLTIWDRLIFAASRLLVYVLD